MRQIEGVALTFFVCSALCLLLAFFFWLARPSAIWIEPKGSKELMRPKTSFESNDYQKIGFPALQHRFVPQKLEVPDLRQLITFYGMNGRPDAPKEAPLMHFGLPGMKKPKACSPSQKIYIDYDREKEQFIFAPEGEVTSLWMEPTSVEEEAKIQVGMCDEQGVSIEGAPPFCEFKLVAKDWVKPGVGNTKGWELGKHRVDGTLLARQQARWYGPDCFLAKHGGDDFARNTGKQRIDFGEGAHVYSVFVALGGCLVWKEGRWQEVEPGKDSLGYPLLYVKKVDERLMTFDLWDEGGQRKVPLTLLKSNEVWAKDSLMRDFKFLGARTKTQCVFYVGEERMLLKPHDWLLLTDQGWVKLESEEEIDNYVARRITGPLFVFDGIVKKEEHQMLVGTLFNASRTLSETMEMAVQKGGATLLPENTMPVEEVEEEIYSRK